MLILFDKFKIFTFLIPGNCFPCHAVIDNNRSKFKIKGISSNQVIIISQSKSRSQNPSDGVDRAIAFSLSLLQGNQPKFRVGNLDGIDTPLTKGILLQKVNGCLIACLRRFSHTNLSCGITPNQLQYREIATV